jgi:hypothetical protein
MERHFNCNGVVMLFDLKIYKDSDESVQMEEAVEVVCDGGHRQNALATRNGVLVARLATWEDNPIEITLEAISIYGNLMSPDGKTWTGGRWELCPPNSSKIAPGYLRVSNHV